MSGDSSAGADEEIAKFGDSTSTEFSPPLKKPKTDPKAEPVGKKEEEEEAEAKVEPDEEAEAKIPFLRKDWNNPEYERQADLFLEQFEENEGYYMDLDKFDYQFAPVKFEWGLKFDDKLSKKDLMDLLIKTAIEAKNEDYGTQLEFVKYVSANVTAAAGFCFYITLWAKDLSSPNPEPKLYQTLVRKFRDKLHVIQFKLKPSQQE